ncbi:uncharacterized protein GGS22DRAFT_187271 [Annulohypoxylon maeteangense]|uniref:uncharacterized protein n=1 Tax=Annulohypoxylon maeteangense TaxID=1927788 RepID=UPI002007D3E5|nr:uncharacterized protein GGS22DRAFT_187271 [Annulohypoxylon maeteangense]KAI0886041.1 hypothetical protein GGS22DRAFT_187271 [Annulohypoxylon maeteangense]
MCEWVYKRFLPLLGLVCFCVSLQWHVQRWPTVYIMDLIGHSGYGSSSDSWTQHDLEAAAGLWDYRGSVPVFSTSQDIATVRADPETCGPQMENPFDDNVLLATDTATGPQILLCG